MTATHSRDVAVDPRMIDTAKSITERELAAYAARTKGSQAATDRARRVLPLGVPSSFQAYDPHPIVVRHAAGSRMIDVDGNEYVDFDMGFGALFAGHMHPAVRAAVEGQLDAGTLYVTPCELNAEVAELLGERYGQPMWRFTNSGTEATMDAIRVARGATGRHRIVKVEGGYHGHHDDVLVSIQPPRDLMGPIESPATVPASAGIPRSRIAETVIAPFNEPDLLAAILEAHSGEIAAIIVEPVQFNIGVVPPEPGFLERLRELADEHGAVLIFDEVKTGVVLAWGGAYEHFGVKPDLFCLAKSIGGGIPIGAFGGKREIMASIETLEGTPAFAAGAAGSGMERSTIPGGATRVAHLGTFNGNPLSMTAGVVTLKEILTKDAYPVLNAMAERLTVGSQSVIDDHGLPGYAINVGPKGCVMFTPERVTSYRNLEGLDAELWAASFFYLANRGILLPPGPDDQWTLSVQHTDADIDRYLEVFGEFAAELTA